MEKCCALATFEQSRPKDGRNWGHWVEDIGEAQIFQLPKFNKSFDALVLVAILFACRLKCNCQDMAFSFPASLVEAVPTRQEFAIRQIA